MTWPATLKQPYASSHRQVRPHEVYADLREGEPVTEELRTRAIERARELGAKHVEFWRPPYGCAADRMAGFVELARIPPAPAPQSAAGELMSENVTSRSSS